MEQNRQYFTQKKRMIEEQCKRDNLRLEDLIAEINSTVNKVMGDSDIESEYIEEEKQNEYKKRYRDENKIPNQIPNPNSIRRAKRAKYTEVEVIVEPLNQKILTAYQEMMIQNLLETSHKKLVEEEVNTDFVKTEQEAINYISDLAYNPA